MLDYDSEDIDGMNDDAGEEQEPPHTGRWTTSSSYDIYLVDTPKEKEADGDNGMPVDEPPKHRRQNLRPRSGKKKNSNIVTNNGDNPKQAKDPADPALE